MLRRPNRVPGAEMTDFYRDVAASTQALFESCLLSTVKHLRGLAPDTRNTRLLAGLAVVVKLYAPLLSVMVEASTSPI